MRQSSRCLQGLDNVKAFSVLSSYIGNRESVLQCWAALTDAGNFAAGSHGIFNGTTHVAPYLNRAAAWWISLVGLEQGRCWCGIKSRWRAFIASQVRWCIWLICPLQSAQVFSVFVYILSGCIRHTAAVGAAQRRPIWKRRFRGRGLQVLRRPARLFRGENNPIESALIRDKWSQTMWQRTPLQVRRCLHHVALWRPSHRSPLPPPVQCWQRRRLIQTTKRSEQRLNTAASPSVSLGIVCCRRWNDSCQPDGGAWHIR